MMFLLSCIVESRYDGQLLNTLKTSGTTRWYLTVMDCCMLTLFARWLH